MITGEAHTPSGSDFVWTERDLRLVERNYLEQRSGRWMYRALAAIDRDAERTALLERMANYEQKHAARWAGLLERLHRPLPTEHRSLAHRAIVLFARMFGVGTVLPLVHRQEAGGIWKYKALAERWTDPYAQKLFQDVLPDEVYYEVSTVEAMRAARVSPGALRSGVLGANDGLASVLAITAGVVGATHSTSPTIIAGLAALVAGAVSMGAAGYVSVRAENEVTESARRLETEAVAVAPGAKRLQLEAAYRAKGLPEEEAAAVARRLAATPEGFVRALLAEEQGLGHSDAEAPGRLAAYTAVAFAIGGAVPIVPFLFLPVLPALLVAIAVSAAGLFLAGILRALVALSSFLRGGAEMVGVGMGAAAATYVVGLLVGSLLR